MVPAGPTSPNRVIARREEEAAHRPGVMLVGLGRALQDLERRAAGRQTLKEKASPKTVRLLKRLQRIEHLPPADQRAVLKFVDVLVASRQR